MRTIAVVNQKGGCGKTTTSINLAAFLAAAGKRTLVVDLDPQGHASIGLVHDEPPASRTLFDLFVDRAHRRQADLREITQKIDERLDLVPANILLSGAPDALSSIPGREHVLSDLLSEVAASYDYAILDCPPGVGLLTFNALMAASEAIIPMDPGFFSLHGIGKQLETLDLLARSTGHVVTPRALITLYVGRTRFARDVVEEIRKHLAGRHFQTVIRYSVKLAEAASHGLPVSKYCRQCAGYEDYAALTNEVIQQEAALPAAAVQASAPRITAEGVVFSLEAPGATRVQVVGDFNGWSLDSGDMDPHAGVWLKTLPLAPGRYRYRFVVDGVWQADPRNPVVEPDPYGGQNSVCVVGEHVFA